MATDERERTHGPTATPIELDLTITDQIDTLPSTVTEAPVEPSSNSFEAIVPRPYIELRPSESPTDPRALVPAMESLNDLLRRNTKTGLLRRIRGNEFRPVMEFLLVSNGQPDPSLRCLVGSSSIDLIDDLLSLLRTAFPDSYEYRVIDWHPRYLEECLPPAQDLPRTTDRNKWNGPQHPAITPTEPYVAGVEFAGHVERRLDWQTPLTPFTAFTDSTQDHDKNDAYRIPLATLIETMLDAELPVIYQVLLHPNPDWTGSSEVAFEQLEQGSSTARSRLENALFPPDAETRAAYRPPPGDRERIDGIASRDPGRCFVVTARAAVLTTNAPSRAVAVAHRLSNALSSLSGKFHTINGHVRTDDELHPGIGYPPGTTIYHSLLERTSYPATYHKRLQRLRRRPPGSRGLVVAPDELPGFLAVDGAGLTPDGRRAIAARPTERAGLPLPPAEQLVRYRGPGMALGMPITHDHLPYGQPLTLPPADQDRHVIAIGPTGSGKSILTETAMLTNVAATDGPAILLDYKGGGTAREYLQAHYRAFGSLDGVSYFDLTRVMPALSVLDIGPLLEAGIPREEARSRIAGQYEEMLETVMGAERYWQAVEAPKAIRNHLRALFDPVHGDEAVPHAALFDALQWTLRDDAPPPVAEDRLAGYFASLLERDRDVFNRVLGGALNRVETIATDGRLAPVFDHLPGEGDPHFDFADVLNEDRVVIFDFGGMEDGAKRTLSLALLANLWRALQARAHDPDAADEPPLVNVYLEEAGALAGSAILDTLLSQGRSFGLSLFLGVQFLGQLDTADPSARTREEAVNETATIIAGQVAVRDDLVDALASDLLPPSELNRRLSRMPRGEWLVRPATAFGTEALRPFLMESLPAPPGHPQGDDPLEDDERASFEAAFEAVRERTADAHGLDHGEPARTEPSHEASTEPDRPGSPEPDKPTLPVDHCYAHTKRLTWAVAYDPDAHAVQCLACGNRYDADIDGLVRAVECHASLDEVDRDDLPIGDLNLKLSAEECAERGLTDAQFRFLQAVYNAMQGRFHPLEYDLTRDSMVRLREYVGIDKAEVQALIDDGLLTKDADHPYLLYSVTPAGRKTIGESYREGLDYGHGEGDLEETSQHILGVIVAERFLEAEFVDDPESPVEHVQTYHDIGSNQRLDVAGLDRDGEVVVAVEVERVNHDLRRAAPEDFDKMAACELEAAIWIVMSHSEAHKILAALREPLDGEPRIEKEYVRSTPVQQFVLEEPGLTKMYTLDQLRKRLGMAQ